jgi:hypothetical protein
MKCPRCNIDMVIGQAIEPSYDENARYILPPQNITYQTMKIITCFKCPSCGHSDDGVE